MEDDVHRRLIAAEVRAEMARQKKTQRELAEAVGLDQASLQRRLVGTRSFRAEELARVAEALGVPVTRFMPAEQTADAG